MCSLLMCLAGSPVRIAVVDVESDKWVNQDFGAGLGQ